MKRRKHAWWIWLERIRGPIVVFGAIMLMALVVASTHGAALATDTSAAQEGFVQAAAQFDDAALAITDTAIAAADQEHFALQAQTAIEEGIQTTGAFAAPAQEASAATHAIAGLAGKEIDIRDVVLKPTHFQPSVSTTA